MTTCRYLIGDTRAVTRRLIDEGTRVDLPLTSPPFLALRSYLPDDHPDKALEIGSEPTPAEFLDTLLELTALWAEILTPTGSMAVELGDTYAGSGGAGGDYGDEGLRAGQPRFHQGHRAGLAGNASFRASNRDGAGGGLGWPLAKCLAMIPELYRVALAYGINPLRGGVPAQALLDFIDACVVAGETPADAIEMGRRWLRTAGHEYESPAGRWRARNVVRWVRPNPPVGALGDKFRPATSDLVIFCRDTPKAPRWFDLDAVRTPYVDPHQVRPALSNFKDNDNNSSRRKTLGEFRAEDSAGAPPLDWWKISPGGYEGSHYAVFPPDLCVTPIQAMCPRQVCTTCGEPRRRIVEATALLDGQPFEGSLNVSGRGASAALGVDHNRLTTTRDTLGWTDCGHGTWRNGITFDPFMGSGTVGMVATGHGRDAIGIDLDERNADLARERIGMFLTVEDWRTAGDTQEGAA